MRKFAKMSLVAAVAVAGLSSTLSAKPLEEAIKDVDVAGQLRYRYDTSDALGADQTNAYKLIVKTSAKVNDAVKANVTAGFNSGLGGVQTFDGGLDANPSINVLDANFAINVAGATVIAGKQSVPGPFVDNSVDATDRGTGAVALVPAGPVTLAAGAFNNTNLVSSDAYELAVIGKFGDISADLWYIAAEGKEAAVTTSTDTYANDPATNVVTKTTTTTSTRATVDTSAYSAHVTAPIAGIVNVDVRYTSKDNKLANIDKATLTKVVASGKAGPVTLAAGYFKSGEDNSGGNTISVGDADSAVNAKVWQASMGALPDATGVLVAAGMNLTPELSAKVTYIDVSCDAVKDASEALLDVSYAMSKNFIISGKYSTYEVGTADTVKTRLQVQYTF